MKCSRDLKNDTIFIGINFYQPFGEQLLSVQEVNKKKHLMLSAVEVFYDFSNDKHFHLKSSTESRLEF